MSRTAQRKRKLFRGIVPGLAGLVLLVGSARANEIDPWTFAYAGLDHFYNVEYEEAIADFESAIAGDPQNPAFYNMLANTYLFQELKRLGQLDGNLYDASNSFLRVAKPKPDANQMAKIKNTLAKARSLCEAGLRENPRDADALYALGTSYGIKANYKFTIERSWFQALRAGSKANDLHEKVLKIDPDYHDAKLIAGLYQYVVGSIPRGIKWFAFIIGYRGSKQKGIRLLQEAMQGGKITTSDAAFLLTVAYNREKEFDYARTLLVALMEYYPRNALLRLEYGRTYSRERRGKEALEVYVAVARDMEAGRPGYDQLPRARLWYQVGMLYQQQGRFAEALAAYARVTERSESEGLVRAYSGLRRGEIFLAQQNLEEARAEYERVAALPYEEPKREAEKRLNSLGG